jgi:hypothetical protein
MPSNDIFECHACEAGMGIVSRGGTPTRHLKRTLEVLSAQAPAVFVSGIAKAEA